MEPAPANFASPMPTPTPTAPPPSADLSSALMLTAPWPRVSKVEPWMPAMTALPISL